VKIHVYLALCAQVIKRIGAVIMERVYQVSFGTMLGKSLENLKKMAIP
jgi:hypothetical protein